MEYQGPCVIIRHCAAYGCLEKAAHWAKTFEPKPHAQYETSVCIFFKTPSKRKPIYYTIVPDDIRFAQVEVNGQVIWDSRVEVPCDMAQWEATRAKFEQLPAITSKTVCGGMTRQ